MSNNSIKLEFLTKLLKLRFLVNGRLINEVRDKEIFRMKNNSPLNSYLTSSRKRKQIVFLAFSKAFYQESNSNLPFRRQLRYTYTVLRTLNVQLLHKSCKWSERFMFLKGTRVCT